MSVETLERVYGHHHPDWMKDAAEIIGERHYAPIPRPHGFPDLEFQALSY